MDGSRFDDLVKSLGAARSRRSVLGALAGVAAAAFGLDSAGAGSRKRDVGDSCKSNDDCASNRCVAESRTRKICHCRSAGDCPGDVRQCHHAACLPNGLCGNSITVGTPCNDGNKCTTGDVCQADGRCKGTPKNCDDNNACTADSCDPATGNCVHTPISCDDNNHCTVDTCDSVRGCVHTPIICNDDNPCTIDTCNPAVGCVFTPVNCDDGNPCTIDSCDRDTGQCVHAPKNCDDNNPCTIDTCDTTTGNCVHTPKNCDDNNRCTVDTCDVSSGNCVNTPIVCNDGDPCTTDSCDAVTGCANTPKYDLAALDAADKCNTYTCDSSTGNLVKTPKQCDPTANNGDLCKVNACDPTTGNCVLQPVVCDDGDLCTVDACDSAVGCVYTPITCPPPPDDCFDAGACQSATGVCSAPVYLGDGTTCSSGICWNQSCCTPDPDDVTCNGACGSQTNNCGQPVDCGSCCAESGASCGGDGDCCQGYCIFGVCQDDLLTLDDSCDTDDHCDTGACCTVCVDLNNDSDNCGSCEYACFGDNATMYCAGGTCQIDSCDSGFADCDNDPTNGCETNIDNDGNNCGTCNNACSGANATMYCDGGECAIDYCDGGYADCDNDPRNGCEVDLNNDGNNCGGCNNVCIGDNATMYCDGGTCGVNFCDGGYDDCDRDPSNGCEVNLNNDSQNCGSCGNVCALLNATATCVGGQCQVDTCDEGYANCTGDPTAGCDTFLLSDPNNCGFCGTVCPTIPLDAGFSYCSAGSCAITCINGYFQCGDACCAET